MQGESQQSSHGEGSLPSDTQPIHVWEMQYPETWLLLEITQEYEGEPVCGCLLATADDSDVLQTVWKSYRNQGMLTMLTYGPPREPRPEVVVIAT